MKLENDRILGDNVLDGNMFTQTRIAHFIPEGTDLNFDLFDEGNLSEIPLVKSAIEGVPDQIRCLINFTIDRSTNSISFNSLSFGGNEYGENPVLTVQSKKIGQWLYMEKIGFRKHKIDEEKTGKDYEWNTLIDEMKAIIYQKAR